MTLQRLKNFKIKTLIHWTINIWSKKMEVQDVKWKNNEEVSQLSEAKKKNNRKLKIILTILLSNLSIILNLLFFSKLLKKKLKKQSKKKTLSQELNCTYGIKDTKQKAIKSMFQDDFKVLGDLWIKLLLNFYLQILQFADWILLRFAYRISSCRCFLNLQIKLFFLIKILWCLD